jgi:hypothetical protein
MSTQGERRPGGLRTMLNGPVTDREPDFVHALPQDNVVGAITALAAEIWMLRDRIAALEGELVERRVLLPDAVEQHRESAESERARQSELRAFVERVLGELARDRTPVSRVDPGVERYLERSQSRKPGHGE